ncbi:cytochrome c biogenesis CcdA family protein [Pseudonocardia broussonetiae]|uniref:Cytochrome c biogenesis protein CcdA n=1 Tax=Pseudonocardia broussonetiae TaxID=2736640 RepID=A0A6M6JIG5_9PSEU|nr:cytochrome c biogenesis CcdA family protein [Pseudonocardia broussonetiae]QJY47818.1 cytochrome c biogenesis protein CcdA [Pseudonocardia broussonetiae]
MNGLTELAISGPLLVAFALALAAGAISFASPCCLPLVPGYVGYLAGLVGADVPAMPGGDKTFGRTAVRAGRWRVAGAAMLFVGGFTVVFTAGVLLVLGLSDWLIGNELLLQRLGGVVTIAMGLVFLGFIPALQRDVRIHKVPRGGLAGAPVLGAVYGLGWTPCLGPTLTGVIALATGTEVGSSTVRGLVLVLAYCAGLGIPFVLIALGAQWAVRTTVWMRRHIRALQITGGIMLLVLGALLVTGAWGEFIAWMRGPIGGYTLPL